MLERLFDLPYVRDLEGKGSERQLREGPFDCWCLVEHRGEIAAGGFAILAGRHQRHRLHDPQPLRETPAPMSANRHVGVFAGGRAVSGDADVAASSSIRASPAAYSSGRILIATLRPSRVSRAR